MEIEPSYEPRIASRIYERIEEQDGTVVFRMTPTPEEQAHTTLIDLGHVDPEIDEFLRKNGYEFFLICPARSYGRCGGVCQPIEYLNNKTHSSVLMYKHGLNEDSNIGMPIFLEFHGDVTELEKLERYVHEAGKNPFAEMLAWYDYWSLGKSDK